MNQILKEKCPCGGEAEKLLKAGETKAPANKKTLAGDAEIIGTTARPEPWAAGATEDWFMVLHKGLWDLVFEEWQHFIPSMEPMVQAFIFDESTGVEARQKPQGVKASKTPATRSNRFIAKNIFFMGKSLVPFKVSVK